MAQSKRIEKVTPVKKQYDRHAPDTEPMTTWVDREWKRELKEEVRAASVYLPSGPVVAFHQALCM